MSTIKALDNYLDNMAAKLAAKPEKAAIYQAKVDAKIAALIAKGKTVTNDGATITSFTLSSSSSGGGSSGSAGTGSSYTLSSSVDGVSGTSKDDTISGIVGTTSTFSIGDNINGYGGNDTLNLIGITSTAAEFVSIDAVETINVRLLDASGQTEFNATDWSGVTTLSNASSIANTTLDVSGLSLSTDVTLYGNTDVNIGYTLSTTGGTANVTLVSVGSAGTATTIGSASATNTANFDLDEANAGLLTVVNVEVQGSLNLARMEAGSGVTSYVVTGSGNAALVTDDNITTFNASAAQGAIDITFSGVSEVAAVGGSGNDTFRFGTTITNSDTVNGGAGTDSIQFSIGGFNRNITTTAVESATITFNDAAGGDANMSAAAVSTINLVAGSASADASVSQIANNTTVVIGANGNGLDDVTLDAASGATTLGITYGTASGSFSVSGLSVTDVANVSISTVANSTGTYTLSSATFDSDAKSLTITTNGGDADLDMSALALGGVTALTIVTNGSADFSLHSNIDGATALTNVTLTASGTAAGIVMNDLGCGIGLTTVTLDANAGADIFASAVAFGNSSTAAVGTYTLIVNAETDSVVGTGAIANSGILVDTTGAATLSINVSAAASSTVHIGDLTISQGVGSASAAGGVLTYSAGTVGNNAIVRFEEVNSSATFTGQQLVLGNVTLGVSAEMTLWSGGVAASGVSDFDVAAITVVMGQSSMLEVAKGSGIETTAGAVGAITLTIGEGATATFDTIEASSVGAISVTLSSGGSANFDNIDTVAAAGTAANVGAIEINGSDAAGVTFGTINASGVGAISVSGAVDVTFGVITTNSVGAINTVNQGTSGTFTIDLSGVVNAAELTLGAATNTITSGDGNDVITLKAGVTGNDVIRYVSSIAGTDNVIGFFAGSTGQDQIEFDVSEFASAILDSDGSAAVAAADVVFGTASGAAYTINASANMLLFTTAYANTAAMLADATADLTLSTATLTSGTFLLSWTDGNDTFVSLLSFEEGASGTDGIATLASASGVSIVTLAQIQGVTPGALVAATNFDFV